MSAALILVLVVTLAYVATHVAFEWLARRFLIVSGAEYLVLGILLGPQVAGLFSERVLDSFAPLVTLALGWVGLIVGMQFYLRGLVSVPALTYRLALLEAIVTLVFVTGVELYLLAWVLGVPPADVIVPAVALGAIACVSAPAGIEIAARSLRHRGPVVRLLQTATAMDAFVAITVFGLLLCWGHPNRGVPFRAPTPTEWAVISVGLGIVGGVLFHLFLGEERKIDRIFVSLLGAVILTSGAAVYLDLSPLLTAMAMGIILVNTSRVREEISTVLLKAQRPFYFVLLIFAGASWTPSPRAWMLPVLLFLVARAVAKVGGARLVTRMNGAMPAMAGNWGRALLGQGGLAVALALDYGRRDTLVGTSIVFTAAIASVLLTDLSSPRLVQSALRPFLGRRAEAQAEPDSDSTSDGVSEPAAGAPEPAGER